MPGLDHDHVGALLEVERDFVQRLVGVARIHLVGLLVALAEVRARADGVAERPVERRGVLGRVGEDARVDELLPASSARADRADASIHHVGRRDDVDARLARE